MKQPTRVRTTKTAEQESLDRLRRIETRITTLSIALGVDERTQKPVFDPTPHPEHAAARLTLPSHNSSLKEIMKAVPAGWSGDVKLFVGCDYVTTLVVTDR